MQREQREVAIKRDKEKEKEKEKEKDRERERELQHNRDRERGQCVRAPLIMCVCSLLCVFVILYNMFVVMVAMECEK